jgi:hypothetical protein
MLAGGPGGEVDSDTVVPRLEVVREVPFGVFGVDWPPRVNVIDDQGHSRSQEGLGVSSWWNGAVGLIYAQNGGIRDTQISLS